MAYRRDGKKAYAEGRAWRAWLAPFRDDLLEAGLPSSVLQDEARWWDCLEHGFLDHHHDPLNFSVDDLEPAQAAKLRELVCQMIPEDERGSIIVLAYLAHIAGKDPT